ncbi:MAG: alpha/beta hydrolase [Chloroflexi bacterium]|nr:alpha/beta hydrolase [Chloroflexota bacterium]MCC6894582.1 alpha/beta hydrolase [Anaerolineae bacterium]
MTDKTSPPGKHVQVGVQPFHVQPLGEGQPTVVFENGLGGSGIQWMHVQPQVAAITRTLAYDRAGQGWSDASPQPRTPQQVTAELHGLLAELQLPPPYILVSHSFGGLISRYFYHQYPAEVQAIVLVDSSHELQMEIIKEYQRMAVTQKRAMRMIGWAANIPFIGSFLAAQPLKEFRAYVPDETWRQYLAYASKPAYYRGILTEMDSFDQYFGKTNIIPNTLGDLPLLVITAAESLLQGRGMAGLTAAQLNDAHQQRQAELARLSSRGRHILVPQATHMSIVMNPTYAQVVSDAIRDLINELRGKSA